MNTPAESDADGGRLTIVSTPIGNLADLPPRAVELLRAVDVIACEDTRHSGILLRAHQIDTRRVSLHQHNEAARTRQVIGWLADGQHVAYISDAGTPLVSDPGARLVHRCARAGFRIDVVPGPSAVTAALAGAGLPADRFYFGGFLPTKKGARGRELADAIARPETSVFFESPHRVAATLQMLAETAPERPVVVARELTKKFEEFCRGTAEELADQFGRRTAKGEFVLVISGAKRPAWMTPEG